MPGRSRVQHADDQDIHQSGTAENCHHRTRQARRAANRIEADAVEAEWANAMRRFVSSCSLPVTDDPQHVIAALAYVAQPANRCLVPASSLRSG